MPNLASSFRAPVVEPAPTPLAVAFMTNPPKGRLGIDAIRAHAGAESQEQEELVVRVTCGAVRGEYGVYTEQ